MWAVLVGDGRRYLLVRAEEIEPPAGPTPEVRGEGVWAALECETPLEHWTVGLEAFGVELDDPFEAWRGERGDRVGLGFDLEWEATAPPVAAPEVGNRSTGGFWQACVVHGEILVGPHERLDVSATGWRLRAWGTAELAAGGRPQGAPQQPVRDGAGSGDRLRHVAPLVHGTERVLYELHSSEAGAAAGWRRGVSGACGAGLPAGGRG